ncbi:RIP-like protein [Lucilia cuprina]|nr:RIP-like protein [Lucilia cuprina]
MSLECPSSPVYHTSAEQKLKSKNAAKLYRFGTPKLRDLLREKCRIRVKEARQMGFSHNRPEGAAGEQISLKAILRQELAELEHDITLQDEIFHELEDELNDWFADQLEEEQNYLIEVAVSQDLVCPICQVSNLKCRIRVKEARQMGFSHNPSRGAAGEQISLKAILRQELAELEHDITLQDEIFHELEDELNDWFADQLEGEQTI